jgi:hypothetical protein
VTPVWQYSVPGLYTGGGLCTRNSHVWFELLLWNSLFLCRSMQLENVKGYELETNLFITCSFKSQECLFGCGLLLFTYFSFNYIVTCRPISRQRLGKHTPFGNEYAGNNRITSYGTRTQKWLRLRGPVVIANDRPVLSSERASQMNKPATVRQ